MRYLIAGSLLLISLQLKAQQPALPDSAAALRDTATPAFQDSVATARGRLQQNNRWVLGAWAAANVVQGSISAGNAQGSDRYFHQMNAYWNTVNLAIAGIGLWTAKKQLAGEHTLARNLRQQGRTEKLLLLNTGLDAAYIMTGLYLHERGTRLSSDQSTGYGSSLVLQGSFLLVFDLVQYFENRRIGQALEKSMRNWQLGPTAYGLGLVWKPWNS